MIEYENKMIQDGDIEIKCDDCESYFIHSVKEQAFFKENGYLAKPKRCVQCRKKRRLQAEKK